MEVSYRRKLHKSYMCIKSQEPVLREYELQMLKGQDIPGLLPMECMFVDGVQNYFYEISGKQQIGDFLSGRKLDYEMLQRILLAVQRLCRTLAEYLLREEGVQLEPEFIYVNLEDGSLYFAYLPFLTESLPEAFERCMEQFLRKIDHQEKAAVELGYSAYQACTRENVSIQQILQAALGEQGERSSAISYEEENRHKGLEGRELRGGQELGEAGKEAWLEEKQTGRTRSRSINIEANEKYDIPSGNKKGRYGAVGKWLFGKQPEPVTGMEPDGGTEAGCQNAGGWKKGLQAWCMVRGKQKAKAQAAMQEAQSGKAPASIQEAQRVKVPVMMRGIQKPKTPATMQEGQKPKAQTGVIDGQDVAEGGWKQKIGALILKRKEVFPHKRIREANGNPECAVTQVQISSNINGNCQAAEKEFMCGEGFFEAKPEYATEALGVYKPLPVGKLVYQGNHGCGDLIVEGEVCLVGKNQEQADGWIDAKGVSRLHARITREGETYYIEDLNSMNGTYLNEVPLEYCERKELCKGDRIRFAQEEYVFS